MQFLDQKSLRKTHYFENVFAKSVACRHTSPDCYSRSSKNFQEESEETQKICLLYPAVEGSSYAFHYVKCLFQLFSLYLCRSCFIHISYFLIPSAPDKGIKSLKHLQATILIEQPSNLFANSLGLWPNNLETITQPLLDLFWLQLILQLCYKTCNRHIIEGDYCEESKHVILYCRITVDQKKKKCKNDCRNRPKPIKD